MHFKKDKQVPAYPERSQCSYLIHDFPHLNVDKDISLAGGASAFRSRESLVMEEGRGEQKYRQIHMERNPDYAQFNRSGAVIVVRVEKLVYVTSRIML